MLRWIIQKKVDPKRHRKDAIESQRDREYMETLYELHENQKGEKVQKEILDTLVTVKRELNQLKHTNHEQATEIKALRNEMKDIRNKPKGIWCAYRKNVMANGIITYDKIFFKNTNQDMPGLNVHEGWILSSIVKNLILHFLGIFKAGMAGTWMVTFDVHHRTDAKCRALVILLKNKKRQEHSELYMGTDATGYHRMMGGRTIYIHLETGDTLYWQTEQLNSCTNYENSGDLFHITACFEFVG